jgi:hypothetical protein
VKKGGGGLREQLNTNPLAQAAVIGVLAIVVGFLLLTRMSGGGDEATTDTTAPTEATATDAGGSGTASPGASAADTAAGGGKGGGAIPDAAAPGETESAGKFVAGPGLPGPMVAAYEKGLTPVLLVKRQGGIDDHALNRITKQLRADDDIALFITNPKHVAEYSRVVGGVDIDHVPALIVLSPKSVSGDQPVASISYGFRGYNSVVQAVEDARYDGKELNYYPGS